ncbi:MAG: SMC-Scp complex subunit ScpB [Candidatus Omnitrophota bacterium]
MTQDNKKAVIEALLFVSDKPLYIDQIKKVMDISDTQEIRVSLRELSAEYEANNRGLRIVEVAGGFRLTTPALLASFLKRLYKERRTERLSKPALETLAIIAYKQPLTKMEIQSLRNVNVDGVIANLLEKGFIRVTGRKDTAGRPLVFGTTRQFLEYFGLKSLEDLPKMEKFSELKPAGETVEENIQENTEEAKQENKKELEVNVDIQIKEPNDIEKSNQRGEEDGLERSAQVN